MGRDQKTKTHSDAKAQPERARPPAAWKAKVHPDASRKSPRSSTSQPIDEVEEASMGSFPASDPPGYGTGHA